MYRRDPPDTHTSDQKNPGDVPQFEGVEFSDGRVALRWLTAKRSVSIWDSMGDMLAIHGHPEYGSELVWHDVEGVEVDGPGPEPWKDVLAHDPIADMRHSVRVVTTGIASLRSDHRMLKGKVASGFESVRDRIRSVEEDVVRSMDTLSGLRSRVADLERRMPGYGEPGDAWCDTVMGREVTASHSPPDPPASEVIWF